MEEGKTKMIYNGGNMNSNYSIIFEEDNSYRYTLLVLDENDVVRCKIRLPVDIYDEILANLSEYRFNNYAVITIDIPPCSTTCRYNIFMMNKEEYMIITATNIVNHTYEKYYVRYENI